MNRRPKIEKRLSELSKLLNGKLCGDDILIAGVSSVGYLRPKIIIVLDKNRKPVNNEYGVCVIDNKPQFDQRKKPFIIVIIVENTTLALKTLIDLFYPAENIVIKNEEV